jgi:hypothetical protein
MKHFKKAATVVTATGLVFAVAWAQTSATLRVKPAAGSKFQYKVVMDTTSSGGPAGTAMKGTYNQWFIAKSKNSKGTVFEIKATNVKMTGGMGDMSAMENAMEKQVITATYSPRGEWISGDVNAGSMGAMSAQAGLQGVIFPQGVVKVGTKWTATVDIGKMIASAGGGNGMKIESGGRVPVSYKVTGFKTIAGKPIVGIAATMNGNIVMAMGQNKVNLSLKSTSSGQIDVGTGMVRTMTTNADVGTKFGQMVMNQKIKMTMTLM